MFVFNGVYDSKDKWCREVVKAMKHTTTYYFIDDITTDIPEEVDYIVSQFTNGHPLQDIGKYSYMQISALGSLLPTYNSPIKEYDYVYWGHYKEERREQYLENIPNHPSTLIIGDIDEWSHNGFSSCSYSPYSRNMDKLYSTISKGRRTSVFGDKYHNGVNIPLRIYEGIACGLSVDIDKDLLGSQDFPKLYTEKELGTMLVNTQAEHTTTCATTILAERAKLYGSYKGGVDCRASILNALKGKYSETHSTEMPTELVVMFSDLALKLMRIASDPTHIDSYVDLEGYSKLIKESQC
jgi:hypothetical protein